MTLYSSYGSGYGAGSMYGYPGGGYNPRRLWGPHACHDEWSMNHYCDPYLDGPGGYGSAYGSHYGYGLPLDYYRSPMDCYGAYNSLAMYEEQLRLMQGISEAERLARWQARLQFEELCEEERALRYSLMAEEERIRLGLTGGYWPARYGGGGYNMPMMDGYMGSVVPWSSYRLPLSSALSARFSPMYSDHGLGYLGSAYGGILSSTTHSRRLLKAELEHARVLRRHARENARQTRRLIQAGVY